MLKTEIALDIGSRKTKIAVCGKKSLLMFGRRTNSEVCVEESCVAAGRGLYNEQGKILAGNAALSMRTECVYPVHDGCPANSRLLAVLLRRIIAEHIGKHSTSGIDLHIAVSRALGALKLRNLERTMLLAGLKGFHFHDSALMAAKGVGMNVSKEHASMLVNIGAETVGTAVVANGGLLWESLVSGGGRRVNKGIINLLRRKHDLIIGERMAEQIKLSFGSSDYIIDGRDIHTGMPRTIGIKNPEFATVVNDAVKDVVEVITDAVKALQPDAAADIAESGILLIGGGSKLCGLCNGIAEYTGLKVITADNAETAVIEGLQEHIAGGGAQADSWYEGYASLEIEADYA